MTLDDAKTMEEQVRRVGREPDVGGPHGSAWEMAQRTDVDHAGVGSWLVHAPGYHLAWSWYAVAACHLRISEGLPPPALAFPSATHELQVLALDPEHEPHPDDPQSMRWLTPPNVVEQFQVASDDDAASLVKSAVVAIVLGSISPDSDFRRAWKAWVARAARACRDGATAEGS